MYEKIVNGSDTVEITDKGILLLREQFNVKIFFPYGSIKDIDVTFSGLQITSESKSIRVSLSGDLKKKMKQLLPTIKQLNSRAPKATVTSGSIIEEKEKILEKSVESFMDFFNRFEEKNVEKWKDVISNIIGSMSADENILHGFRGSILYINGERDTTTSYIGVITDKRFYYAGSEGKAVFTYLKSGIVELKDVHAISLGKDGLLSPPYVKFEVKNDDYKLTTFADTARIKEKLEEGIKACEKCDNTSNVVQMSVSPADELKKFKELLDMGVITQEEFDAKKKQLLGL